MSRPLFWLALSLVSAVAGVASAEEVVRHRLTLPLEGVPVDVASFSPGGDGPIRVRISGTISSSIDGSELDALSRRSGGTTFVADGPFIRLPEGARLVESDPAIHRYLFELPRGEVAPVAVHLSPLAARNLVTWSEVVASSSGAFELEILGEPAPMLSTASVEGSGTVAEAAWLSEAPEAAAALIAIILSGLAALWGVRRHRRRPEVALLRRVRAAAVGVEAEAVALGPAFEHVIATAGQLRETASDARAHLRQVEAALRRTRRLSAQGAEERRAALSGRRAQIIDGLQGIAERLEETAASLAASRADQSRPVEAESLLSSLQDEMEAAVGATREAELAI